MNNGINWTRFELQLRNPFTVSYGSSTTRTAFCVNLKNDEGWGEGTIPFYYGINFKDMTDYWDACSALDVPFPETVAQVSPWLEIINGPKPAQTALDIAFLDRIAKNHRQPLYALLGLEKPQPMTTTYTISIDTPDKMAEMAEKIRPFPRIKIKLGSPGEEDLDEKRISAVRQARPDAALLVDANAGWAADDAVKLVKRIEKYQIELIEQPTYKDDFVGMGLVQSKTEIPIVADESVQSIEDIDKLHEAGVKGINVKLMKCGGVLKGLQMIQRAKKAGMRIMLGCMVETSLGIAAMTHLMSLADWIDLDTPMLISNDPFSGIHYSESALLTPSLGWGVGVTRNPTK